MTLATRIVLILMLLVSMAGSLIAQEATPQTTPATQTATATDTVAAPSAEAGETSAEKGEERSPARIREKFIVLVQQHPPKVARVLKLEPELMSNAAFLAKYPELERFLAENQEVRRNPHYYLSHFENPETVVRRSAVEEILEGLMIFATTLLVAFALAWLVRTIIEQRRWNRLSRTQTEVHNKILDRFGTSQELLEYVRSPAGSKFLESAPIPLHAEAPLQQSTPMTQIIWSIQLGVVVVAGALGTMLVSLRYDSDDARALFALGAIAFSVGVGFIASALVSMSLSRRLGLWQSGGAGPSNDPELMR